MDHLTRYWAEPVTIGDDNKIRGLGLVWYDGTKETTNEFSAGKFEALAPGAEIQRHRQDVLCCFNHDRNQVLGRESNGTLQLAANDRGLAYTVEPNVQDPHHESIRQKVIRKDARGSSAHFRPLASRWSDGVLLFTKILLLEIGPVTSPAMTGTINYSEGQNELSDRHYQTQKRLAEMPEGIG
jgi:HK97 family phage prohead protease